MQNHIRINRAPVLTLWAAVVAERLGFKRDEALTLAKAVAGLNAQSKGRRLGLYEPDTSKPKVTHKAGEEFTVEIVGRSVPVMKSADGIRALIKGKPIDPASVERYLRGKFGEDFDAARAAMMKLAKSYKPQELAGAAYGLYEEFRPEVPTGVRGWGAAGMLDLERVGSLAKHR